MTDLPWSLNPANPASPASPFYSLNQNLLSQAHFETVVLVILAALLLLVVVVVSIWVVDFYLNRRG